MATLTRHVHDGWSLLADVIERTMRRVAVAPRQALMPSKAIRRAGIGLVPTLDL